MSNNWNCEIIFVNNLRVLLALHESRIKNQDFASSSIYHSNETKVLMARNRIRYPIKRI